MCAVLTLPGVEMNSVGLAVGRPFLFLEVTTKHGHKLDALQWCGEIVVFLLFLSDMLFNCTTVIGGQVFRVYWNDAHIHICTYTHLRAFRSVFTAFNLGSRQKRIPLVKETLLKWTIKVISGEKGTLSSENIVDKQVQADTLSFHVVWRNINLLKIIADSIAGQTWHYTLAKSSKSNFAIMTLFH